MTGEALLPEEMLLLETYAEKESASAWHLDRAKTMAALENGHQIAELREFLQARDEQPLPETVEGFLREAELMPGGCGIAARRCSSSARTPLWLTS